MQFTAGEIIKGKVTGITNFGVFVDLGENKSGLVHISEVANSYVENINEILKIGDEVTAKILNIGDDGKISLSIKRALDTEKKPKREKKVFSQPKPDNSYTWTPKKQEPASFEEMMNQFKQSSDERMSDLKRNMDSKRGGGSRRGGR